MLLLGLDSISSGQQRARISLIKYDQLEGLSSYNIRQIIKDQNGFLWVASQDCLTRFDGRTFLSYTSQSSPKYRISGPDVRKIIEDKRHKALWVLPNTGALDVIDISSGEVIKNVPIPRYAADDWNITMSDCGDRLWIGSFRGLKILDTKSWQFIPSPKIQEDRLRASTAAEEVNCIARDGFGNVWVCYTGYGIVIYDGTSLKRVAVIKLQELGDHLRSHHIRINDFTQVNDHEMMFATEQGLRKVSYTKAYRLTIDTVPVKILKTLNHCSLDAVKITGPNKIMISGNSHLYQFDPSLDHYLMYDESIGEAESKWINYVQAIYPDGDRIWLSCQQGVAMMRTNTSPFSKYYYDEKSKNKLEHLRSISVLPDNDILCGLTSGLVRVNHADYSFSFLDKVHLYNHIFSDSRNLNILSRDGGLYVLDKKHIKPIESIYHEFTNYRTCTINSHIFLGDSVILMGTESDEGVLIWNYKRHTVKKIDASSTPGLASNTVNNIYLDRRGNLWVLSDRVITVISKNFSRSQNLNMIRGKKYPQPDLFFDMCEAGDSYWIASYGHGILQVDDQWKIKKFIGVNDGLCNNGVYNIFNIGDSSLLVTSNNGLSFYNLKRNTFKSYFSWNGLQSNSFEEVTAITHQSKIYAGGINGFTIIDPAKLFVNKTPPVPFFEHVDVKLNNEHDMLNSALDMKKITVPRNWLQASISFVGIDFDDPKRVTYQYRIKEIDTSWINNGHRDVIDLIGLPPETYTIEVKAVNGDGYRSRPKALILRIEPKWFQTLWFKLGVILLGLAIIIAFYQYRIKQIRIQQQIRREIANDLHDDLGSSLNSVKIFTHLAIEKKQNASYLTEIEKLATRMTAGLRDMLWVLEDSRDDLDELMERIKNFAVPIACGNQVNFQFHLDSDLGNQTISKTEKRNLLLIAKEAVNNAFKYAECSAIEVIVCKSNNNKISLSIRDDGKGFDIGGLSAGYGLQNMKYRAEQINYKLKINSSAGNGTYIVVEKR